MVIDPVDGVAQSKTNFRSFLSFAGAFFRWTTAIKFVDGALKQVRQFEKSFRSGLVHAGFPFAYR